MGKNLPVFVMEIIFIECPNKLLVLLLYGLQIDLLPILFIVGIEIIWEKDCSIIKTFHFVALEFLGPLKNFGEKKQ